MTPDEEKTRTNFEQLKADAMAFAETIQLAETEEEMADIIGLSWFHYAKFSDRCNTCKELGGKVCKGCFADWLKEKADIFYNPDLRGEQIGQNEEDKVEEKYRKWAEQICRPRRKRRRRYMK